ncbi:hypothetical protein P9911_008215 [Klebsiella oxytoca]|uniref:hypothetical protein n=1 Tax=Klebsiella oxytoca TaxID=571 RepID=UPI00254EB48D|nr:hypothetical protein [Klebsiella oxytoca]MEC5505822.1 hypothetical protein [Klebsiella oxytoca]
MFTSERCDFITFGGCYNGSIKEGDYEAFLTPDEDGNTGKVMLYAKPLVRHRDPYSNKKIDPIALEEFTVKEFLASNGKYYLVATYGDVEPVPGERLEQIIAVWSPRPFRSS